MENIELIKKQIVLFFNPDDSEKIELSIGDIVREAKKYELFLEKPKPIPSPPNIKEFYSFPLYEFREEGKTLLITRDRIDFSWESKDDDGLWYIDILFKIFSNSGFPGTNFNRVGIVNQYFLSDIINYKFSKILYESFKDIYEGEGNFEISLNYSKKFKFKNIDINNAILINSAAQNENTTDYVQGYMLTRDINSVLNNNQIIDSNFSKDLYTKSENIQDINKLTELVYEKNN